MSFQVCCVPGCMNRGKGLHRFPNPEKDPDRFKIWKLFSGVDREGKTEDAIVNTRRICRSHFSVQFHYPRNKLCRMAVPTLLPGNHPTETEKTIYYSSRASEPVNDRVKACDIASSRQSLDSPTLHKSSNESPIHEIAANKPTESHPETISDTQAKITRDRLKEDAVTDKIVDVVEHGPPITKDQGDVSMHHDDDPLRPVAEAGNDSNDPVDKSVDAVEHGRPMKEDQVDISMYHDDDPLRNMAEARNHSNNHVNKSVNPVEHGPPITEDQGDISMYHYDDPLRPVAEARNDSNDPVDKSVDAVEHGRPMTEDQGDISMYHDDDPLRPVAEAGSDSITLGVPVHRFPHPDKHPDLFAAWVSAIGDKLKETDKMKIFNNKRICHHHFDPRDKMETGSNLKRSAIPSVHLDCVRQTLGTFMEADHSYCSRREGFRSESMMDITNLPGPSSPMMDISKPGSSRLADELTKIPVPSGSTSTTCETVPENAHPRTSETKFDADDPVDRSVYVAEYEPPITEDQGDISMYHDDDPLRLVEAEAAQEAGNDSTIEDEEADGPPDGTDECYFCNVCKESIKGFRYTCVQCEDWDLCGACEARAAHATHYVLRIPTPRPYKEIQAVLTAVRQQLINKNIIPGKADSVKEEPNSEPEDAIEPDTLDWEDDFYEEDNVCIELEDGEHPPRKRLRPEASSTHGDRDLTSPESPKPNHDRTTDDLCNPEVTSSKDIQPGTLPNDNPSIPGSTPQTTGTLLPTIALNSKITLTLKPISRLPLGARVIKLSACFGKKKTDANCRKINGDHPLPRQLLYPGPSNTHSDQNFMTLERPKPTHNRTTHAHFNHDVTKSAKDIPPGTLPNDSTSRSIPKPGLNRLICTMPQTTGTLFPTSALRNSRTPLTRDLTTPESPKPIHDRTTHVHFNHDVTNSAKHIQPGTLPNNTPTIPKSGLNRLIGTMPETTGTLFPTSALHISRTPLTLDLTKPESQRPTHNRTTHVHFNHGVTNSGKDIQPGTLPNNTPTIPKPGLNRLVGTMPQTTGTLFPTSALHNSRTPLTLDHTTPDSPKPTHKRTTHVHFNHDVTNSAKDIQTGTLPNNTPTIPKPGLNRLIGTIPQTTGTLFPTSTLNNSRTTLPLGLRVVKKTVIVENSASRLSEENTAMRSPTVDKSSSQRPDHTTAVSPPTTTITSLERAAMRDPKANSNCCLRILKGSSPPDVVKAPKSKVRVKLEPIDDSMME